jgi:hypothetical protein
LAHPAPTSRWHGCATCQTTTTTENSSSRPSAGIPVSSLKSRSSSYPSR